MTVSETTLTRADRLFRERRLDDALSLYETALQEMPELAHHIRFNMRLVEKWKTATSPTASIGNAEEIGERDGVQGESSAATAHSSSAPVQPTAELTKPEGMDDDTFERIVQSGLFDVNWYLKQYGHLLKPGENPLAHYLEHGVQDGLNPSLGFDTRYYLECNPNVAAADINPLVHYILNGKSAGRTPLDAYELRIERDEKLENRNNEASDNTESFTVGAGSKPFAPDLLDVQDSVLTLEGADSPTPMRLKVDAAYRFGNVAIVVGWSVGALELGLMAGEQMIDARRVSLARPDVASHFQLASGDKLGFVLVARIPAMDLLQLTWKPIDGGAVGRSAPLRFEVRSAPTDSDIHALGPALGSIALELEPHSPAWTALIAKIHASVASCASARGYLELATANVSARAGVVVGWVVHKPGTIVWLEDEYGRSHSFEHAFLQFRQDIADAFGQEFGNASRDTGFILRFPSLEPGMRVRLKAVDETGIYVLHEIQCDALPEDPVAAARWLFGIATPLVDMHRRVALVDETVLAPLIAQRQASWNEIPVTVRQLGKPPACPEVSIVIPLYGRADFVEHQLIEFSADPWLREHAEIVYVIDDPKLVDGFGAWAESMWRLYRVPFRWVWGKVNRGFSGANNLGAAHSTADVLLFLNSDVFPQKPGWVELLLAVLREQLSVGAVGPRLVFGDGGIQHAGMEFMRRDDLGVWVNHHPRMGLDPSLDPHRTLARVPAVTGACLAVRRADFERVGGWDTGYLIGDFEDSDLCLKLRAQGLDIAYLPTVQLTHLERQSFKLLGQDDFRQRVVIYNAVRHQTRWGTLIESLSAAKSAEYI